MNTSTALLIIRLIDFIALVLDMTPVVRAEFNAIRDEVRKMVESGVDPTDEQLKATGDRLQALAQSLKAKARK